LTQKEGRVAETETIDLEREIDRLRKVAQRVLDLDLRKADLYQQLVDLRRAAKFALDRVKIARGQSYKPLAEVRKIAAEVSQTRMKARHRLVIAEIRAILVEKGELSYEAMAAELNNRGRVKPFRSLEWSASTVRFIVKRNK
jgi:hypothetical protein